MSQNRPKDDDIRSTGTGSTASPGTGSPGAGMRSTGGAGTGATDAGTTRDTGMTTTGGVGTGQGAAGAAQGIAAQAKEQAQQYGQKVTDAATQAKDYVSDKFKDLQNKDYRQVAEEAKDYARQNPGQALVISAAAGFLIGLLIRSGNRR